MQTEKSLLTKKQAAKFLNVSEGSIERLMRHPQGIRHVRVGGLVRFRIEDLCAYLDQNVRGGAAASR